MSESSNNTASPDPALTPGAAWGIVGALWLALVINYADRQAIFSIYPVLKSELGFTATQFGLVGTVFIWVYSLASIVVGRLADVVRRDRLLVASIILWSLSTYGTSLSGSVGHVLFWRAMMGVTEALFFPAAVSMIGSIHSEATRSRAISLYASGQMFGIVLGGVSGGWFADHWGWRRGFVVMAIVGIVYAPVLWMITRRVPQMRSDESPRFEPRKQAAASPRQLLQARCYWAMAFAFFWFCAILWMIYNWLPTLIQERFHLSLAGSGWTATFALQFSTVVGLLAGGFLTDHVRRQFGAGRFYVSSAGLFLAAPFAWLAITADSLALLKVSCASFGFFAGFMICNVFAGPYDVIHRSNFGLGAGTLITIGGLSGGLAMLLAGWLKESVGILVLMAWGSSAAMFAACIMALVARRHFHSDRIRAGWQPEPAQ